MNLTSNLLEGLFASSIIGSETETAALLTDDLKLKVELKRYNYLLDGDFGSSCFSTKSAL